MIQAWRTSSRQHPRKPTTQEVVEFYSCFTTPGPKNGVEMLRVLRHWRAGGLAGDTIAAYPKLRPKNAEDVKQSIHLFRACYIGVELPKFITGAADISQPRWTMRRRYGG